ncbi:MAG: hypothetical protein HY067_12450 [Betaproteobacteria bacterium]|nr:hypothetical protein [Betaproteobacteria bacterium]
MNIQSVPASRGWQWIVAAFSLFKKNPLIWIVLHLILILIGAGLSILPVIGPYLLYLLTPLLLGGLMTAANDIESGQDIEIAHLFRGFRQNTLHLITVGGVYLVGQVVISGVMIMLGGPEFQQALRVGVEGIDPVSITPEVATRILMALLVGMALFVPLAMATWFSPALVILDNQSGFAAMGESVRACLRNMQPFLVYGIFSLLLLIVASIPFGLGLVLWIPVMVVTMYTSYRDIFATAATPEQATA